MTSDKWKKYIQVNIFGRTLQDLNNEGIVLETVLSEIGCPNVWIGEAMMYDAVDSQSCSSNQSLNDIEQELASMNYAPILSTTLATGKCPRFSTPAVSHFAVDRKFTLNLPENYSRINSNGEEKFEVTEEYCDKHDVEELLSEVVKRVVEMNSENKVILSTTVTKTKFPRSSTPIRSQMNVLETFTLHIPEVISDIESGDEEEVISEYEGEVSERKEEIIRRQPETDIEPVTYISARRTETCCSNASNLMSNSKIEDGSPEPRKKRLALSRSTTERSFPVSSEISGKAYSDDPDQHDEENVIFYNDNNRTICTPSRGYSFGAYQDYNDNFVTSSRNEEHDKDAMNNSTEIKPFPIFCSSEDLYSSGPLEPVVYSELVGMKLENLVDEQQNDYFPMDVDYGENNMEDNYFSAPEGDETEVMPAEELSQRHYTPPPPGLIKTKSILKGSMRGDEGDDKTAKKTVSFGVPKNKMTDQELKLNEKHVIKCHFKDCNKGIRWRFRYGKRRLFDHLLCHCDQKWVKCRSCVYTCQTIDQMKYHYRKIHRTERMKGYGIADIPFDDAVVAKLWEECFGTQKQLIGVFSRSFRKRKHANGV
uniref:C2H2-type domain-containing protein n=1 Tax=Caenorhabditis tropicalis TaxID=1561998 RepID=A0A1I7TCC2_9PELO